MSRALPLQPGPRAPPHLRLLAGHREKALPPVPPLPPGQKRRPPMLDDPDLLRRLGRGLLQPPLVPPGRRRRLLRLRRGKIQGRCPAGGRAPIPQHVPGLGRRLPSGGSVQEIPRAGSVPEGAAAVVGNLQAHSRNGSGQWGRGGTEEGRVIVVSEKRFKKIIV
uniref:(northern house mosquito) hypothetical protein n=1 Tax=Culex pipiens TaxID=7175 RepID=A0A8D8GTN1_CULPI